jgi:hypothetical protein
VPGISRLKDGVIAGLGITERVLPCFFLKIHERCGLAPVLLGPASWSLELTGWSGRVVSVRDGFQCGVGQRLVHLPEHDESP